MLESWSMKKLSAILVLALLIITPSYSKVIKLSKCSHHGKFDKSKYDKWYYIIDTKKETASMIMDYKSEFIKKTNERSKSRGSSYKLKEVMIRDFDITFVDQNFVRLYARASGSTYVVNLNEKTVSLENTKIKCR